MESAVHSKLFDARCERDLMPLRNLSGLLGNDPLLVQANNSNTSIKLDGTLWIKASGKWLANATREELFLPLELAEVQTAVCKSIEFTLASTSASATTSRPSVETAMHATLPHRVVVHVHSINTIAWAIRADGASQLEERLAGLHWQWIPYAASGIPLAREIRKAIAARPETDVFILANHGLVVCGDDCDTAKELLDDVERRLAIAPRRFPKPDSTVLTMIARFSGWQLPEVDVLHGLGTDAVSRKILRRGVLYPCQAIFLGETMPLLPPAAVVSRCKERENATTGNPPFIVVERSGVMLNANAGSLERATLIGLAQVLQRVDESAPLRYLRQIEVSEVLSKNIYGYNKNAKKGHEVWSPEESVFHEEDQPV